MKLRLAATLAGPAITALAVLWLAQPPAALGNPAAALAWAQDVVPGGPAAEKYEFVGTGKCRVCHLKIFKSWESGKHGKALDSLRPGQATAAKARHGLDPDRDYTRDKGCLECHVTGLDRKGGYAVPKPGDKKAEKKAKEMAGVGCESCHGAGSETDKVFQEIHRTKRKYKVEELYKAGLTRMEVGLCKTCHNPRSPTFDKEAKFDYEELKKTVHAREELKQRE
ncbi:MAG: cytochrome c family protein [Planctomycetes bacterium]|nr:cytochrome c family protein [Planctomycetota bacterium]